MTESTGEETAVKPPPRGLAIVMMLGPCLVWCGEYIGSGEVILSTRTGALFGTSLLWVPLFAIFTKFWIGLAGARYTVCTGECMIDMMARTPGPRNWAVWLVFIGQVSSGAIATGALASVAGVFAAELIPLPPFLLGWCCTLFVIGLVWGGQFDILKKVMSFLVMLIILGVCDVAIHTWPGWSSVLRGAFGFQLPDVPAWAAAGAGVKGGTWKEILPLLGWAAGGFASQVWYTYWVFGAGYGMANGRQYGQPLDGEALRALTPEDAKKLRGWGRVVIADATMALVIGSFVTAAFMLAGAGVLGPAQKAPSGPEVATTLSTIFSERWGAIGAHLFILAGLAAMISTMLGQFAGWPRLLADCARILFPPVARVPWKRQFQIVLIVYAISNMIIVYSFGLQPVFLVKLGAVLDGLLLTPIQAVSVGVVLFLVMPRFYSAEVARILRPNFLYAIGLLLAFLLFGYFCVFQLPNALAG